MRINYFLALLLFLFLSLQTPVLRGENLCLRIMNQLALKIIDVRSKVAEYQRSSEKISTLIKEVKQIKNYEDRISKIEEILQREAENLTDQEFSKLSAAYIREIKPAKKRFDLDLKLLETIRINSLKVDLLDSQKINLAKLIAKHLYYPETRMQLIELLAAKWGLSDEPPQPSTLKKLSKVKKKIELQRKDMMEQRTLSKSAQSYEFLIMHDFIDSVANLKAGQVWFDGGSGEFGAVDEGINDPTLLNPEVNVVAVTKEIPLNRKIFDRLNAEHADRFKGIIGTVEDTPNEEIGRVDLISDVYGAYAYAPHFEGILNKYLRVSNIGGKIYLRSAQVRSISISLRGVDVSINEWYKFMAKRHGFKIVNANEALVILEKTEEAQQIPPMTLTAMNHEMPPWRMYRWK